MIIIKITDGLGNQLFQYAYALYLKKQGYKVYIDTQDINNIEDNTMWTKLCDRREYRLCEFNISLQQWNKDKKFESYQKVKKNNSLFRYLELLQLSPYLSVCEKQINDERFKYRFFQNYYVRGSFFNKKYYESVFEQIIKEISLKKMVTLPQNIYEIINNYNTVSIHFRRGDFLKVGRNISESDYYKKAIEYIRKRVGRLIFLVFSDDIQWVKQNINLRDKVFFVSDLHINDCEELILMSKCNHNIIANSTFSFWGALLNMNEDKIVIAPQNWRDDLKPKEWVNL